MLDRASSILAALVVTSCLLEDPYFIDHSRAATEDEDDRTRGEMTLPEPEPEAASDDAEPESKPTEVNPVEILVPMPGEPVEPEPTTADDDVLEPAADDDVSAPSPVPEPEPSTQPEPVPDPPAAPDAGAEPCETDALGCEALAECGNGIVESSEECDGADLAGRTCASEGFSGGLLQCSEDCALDTTECVAGPTCEEDLDSATGLAFEGHLNNQRNDTRYYTCSTGGRLSEDVSLAWTAPSSGCFEFRVDSTQEIDTIIAVFEDCALDTPLACDNEYGSIDPDSILEFEAVANTTYAISIDAYEPGDEGPIELTIVPCDAAVPADWECPDARYGMNQDCDCGCGALDPDCADATVDSCDSCGASGSCGSNTCSDIDPEQNWNCEDDNGGPFGR